MCRSITPVVFVTALVTAIACAGEGSTSTAAGTAGLATVFDSSADTIVARVNGDVSARYMRSLTDAMRIAPSIDDTSLFSDVSEFVVDRADRLWVYDTPSNAIFLFAPDGKLIRRVGRRGGGPGEFFNNGGMTALPDTGIAQWDARNARISFLTSAGDFRTSWRTPVGFWTGHGLLSDRDGTLRLRRPVGKASGSEVLGRMGLASPTADGALTDSVAPPPLDVATVQYVAVYPNGRGRASYSAPYSAEYLWAWNPAGWFVVANSASGDILLARNRERPIVIRRRFAPIPVPDAERAALGASLTKTLRNIQPDWSLPQPMPDTKPPLMSFFVARDGRIWARIATPSERVPDSELLPSHDTTPPTPHFRSALVYEVFDADGGFLGRITFPLNSTLMQADGDTVWLIERDENDRPAVVRARITPGLAEMPPATASR
jgi:hypothetical protein